MLCLYLSILVPNKYLVNNYSGLCHMFMSLFLSVRKIQRSFTKHITGMQSLEYSERLVSLKLYSLQRRRERYCIIYVWKIIEGLVPNFSKPIVCSYSEHRGRSCIISHVNLGILGSLAYNSFRWRAIRLFNAMPKYIRCISSCSVVSFKSKLDCYLKNIVALPGRPGFSNSLDSGDILRSPSTMSAVDFERGLAGAKGVWK